MNTRRNVNPALWAAFDKALDEFEAVMFACVQAALHCDCCSRKGKVQK